MRTILYKLAHRLLTSSPTPSYVSADRFHLHLSILLELELYDDAHTLLDSNVGNSICATNLSCNEIRREVWRLRNMTKEEGERAQARITEQKSVKLCIVLNVILNCIFEGPELAGVPVSPGCNLLLLHIVVRAE